MEALLKDLKSGARSLARQPGSALISVLILSLGIGLSTFMFSLVYGVLFRGLDVPGPDRIAVLERVDTRQPDGDGGPVPGHDFLDFRERLRSFQGLAAYYGGTLNLADAEGPERYQGAWVSANVFDVLRMSPVLGRTFVEGEDRPGLPPAVLLGHHVWRDRYGSDPGVVGRSVRVNGRQGTVVGVMPEGFRWPSNHDVWVAMDDDPRAVARGEGRSYAVIGRLANGVSWDQAGLEVARVAEQLAREHPEENEGTTAHILTVSQQQNGDEITVVFVAMMVAVLCVLLVACANVANLLLARATTRMREAGVRVAMGAGRLRVMAPFVAEALVLACIGAAAGTALAYGAVHLFDRATAPALTGRPYFVTFEVDLPVLLFAVGVTALTALMAGAAPAFQVSRADVNEILKDEGRGSSSLRSGRLGRTLVMVEVAFSVALLVGAGLMTRSMVQLGRFELPFDADAYVSARVGLFEADYPTREDRQRFWSELERRVREAPGVAAAALSAGVPGTGSPGTSIRLEGQTYPEPSDRPRTHYEMITPGYFTLLGADLLEGEAFADHHTMDVERVAVVNRSFAERFWPGGTALGRRFRTGTSDTIPWLTVIGVVGDLQMQGLQPTGSPGSTPDGFYVPVAQSDPSFLAVVARRDAGGSAASLGPILRDAVRAIDGDVPLYALRTVSEGLERSAWFYVVFGSVFITFGAVALFMASVGLYGVLSFSVSRRTQEMGIRMALGAGRRQVIRLVLRQGLTHIVVGLAIGLVMAAGVSSVVGFLMFQVNPKDPLVFGAVVLLTLGVGVGASLVPARRATGVDPMVALRSE
ncbi:MAG: ABC transporter permease [Gemmatimonadetes bacterium]|nr:ABC transporter permease [Gemmatimonadota bacterium]